MKEFHATLSNGPVQFLIGPVDGLSTTGAAILVNKPRNDRNTMDTTFHETLHHSLPDATEREIERIAADLTAIAWRAGYRLRKPSEGRKKAHPRIPQRRAQPQDHADAARAFSALTPCVREPLTVHLLSVAYRE